MQTQLTITRLTRDTALALIFSTAIDPNMCKMMLVTMPSITMAAHKLNPIRRKETVNTAAMGCVCGEAERGRGVCR